MAKKTLSIVITVFKTEESLKESFFEFMDLRDRIPHMNLEFIFVVDGSPDNSLGLLKAYKQDYPFIKIISFTRNYGAMNAILAGLAKATGDCVTVLPSDMQDPPELITLMAQNWDEGYKAVYAVRRSREDPLSSKIFSRIYYYLLRLIAIPDYPETGFDVFLIDRQVMTELLRTQEKNCHIQNAVFLLGFNHTKIYYDRQKRNVGKSSWTFSKKVKYFIDSFVSYSYVPIRFMTAVGFLVSMLSMIYGLVVLANVLISGTIEQPGWASLMVVISFLLGIIMVMIGVLGEYVWRVLDEVRPRSLYVVDEYLD